MLSDQTNHLNKYFELPKQFHEKSVELEVLVRQSTRLINELIQHVRGNEKQSDFLVHSAKINEQVLEFLAWQKNINQEILNDSKAIIEGARLRNQMRDYLDMINVLVNQRETVINEFAAAKRTS